MQPFGGIGLRTPRRYLEYAEKMRRSRGLRPSQRRGWRIAGKVVVGSAPKSASAPCEGFRFESRSLRNFPTVPNLVTAWRWKLSSRLCGKGALPTGPEDAPWRSYGWHWSGRPPKDKRVVEDENSRAEVWWGPVNIPIEPNTLVVSRERARGYLNTRDRLYCVDELRVGIRSIASMCASSVHGHNIVFQWGRLIPAYCKLCD